MSIKLIVFDIGRTLMEYKDMPNSWQEYYPAAMRNIRDSLGLDVSDSELENSLEIFKSYSPRLHYREVDYTPEHIFKDVTKDWRCSVDIDNVITTFFASMKLTPYIYDDTIPTLQSLRDEGIKIAALTDVATGMPDELHKSYFQELLPYIDMYVSSITCGYRKPSAKGLEEISKAFAVSSSEMLMVGDEKKDIEVANRFGCPAILIERDGCFDGMDFGQKCNAVNLEDVMKFISLENRI